MFMSTRYKKRHEPLDGVRKRPIFSVDDSLAKLCEFLNNESSVTKLITPKYKDFRNQKLKFDQKTRLNNAIWRAWHIQYKMRKKARFLQFEAPFSDEMQHSISQAVLLEGKYWKRRLETVSREFKKWRRLHKEKLLRNSGLMIEEITAVQEESSSESEIDEEDSPTAPKLNHDKGGKTIDTLSAMYAFPDTLFSSLDQTKKEFNHNHTIFKDSSGMIQPTLNHLNPSFDELLENFDFLFTDFAYYQAQPTEDNSAMLMQAQDFLESSVPNSNQYMQRQEEGSGSYSVPDMMYQQQQSHKNLDQKTLQDPQNTIRSESYQQLPPQLQAPNLTARIQAAMSTRPPAAMSIRLKPIPRNKSDPALSTKCEITSHKREGTTLQSEASAKKPRRNLSNDELANLSVTYQKPGETYSQQTSAQAYIPTTVTPILPKTPKSSNSLPILPKVSQNTQHIIHSVVKPSPMLLVGPDTRPSCNENTSGHSSSAPQGLSYVIVNSVPVITQTTPSIVKNITAMTPLSQSTESYHSQSQVMMTAPANSNRMTQQPPVVNPPLDNFLNNQQQQQFVNMQSSQTQMSGINETQLVQLAQLLQNAPQGTEATLSYLELLQQQLSLMLKHQQENLQFKQQIQHQAEKMLGQQPLQHTATLATQQQVGLQTPSTSSIAVQSPVIVSSTGLHHQQLTKSGSIERDMVNYQHQSSSEGAYSRQSSLEIPLPKELQQTKIIGQHIEKLIDEGIGMNMKPAHILSKDGRLSHNYQQPQQGPQSFQPNYEHITSTPTTLDSAIALVTLRHGSLSPPEKMKTTASAPEGNRITVLRSETSSQISQESPSTSSSGQQVTKQVEDRTVYNVSSMRKN